MIVDVHGHWGPWFFATEVGSTTENLRLMDAYGIDVQLVSAVEAVVYDPATGNEALAAAIAGEPRLRGLLVVDPRELDLAERQLAQFVGRGSADEERPPLFVGAKIHTHYSGTPAGTPAMADALRLLADYDLPVLVHTWGAELLGLAEVVAAVEGARVVAGHMGGPDWRLVPEAAARTDRLWFEPCYSVAEGGRVRWVLDRIGPERLLFGSDSTLIDPAVTLGAVRAAALTAEEERLVMSANAISLFGLPPAR